MPLSWQCCELLDSQSQIWPSRLFSGKQDPRVELPLTFWASIWRKNILQASRISKLAAIIDDTEIKRTYTYRSLNLFLHVWALKGHHIHDTHYPSKVIANTKCLCIGGEVQGALGSRYSERGLAITTPTTLSSSSTTPATPSTTIHLSHPSLPCPHPLLSFLTLMLPSLAHLPLQILHSIIRTISKHTRIPRFFWERSHVRKQWIPGPLFFFHMAWVRGYMWSEWPQCICLYRSWQR